jgi:hypothetical protein
MGWRIGDSRVKSDGITRAPADPAKRLSEAVMSTRHRSSRCCRRHSEVVLRRFRENRCARFGSEASNFIVQDGRLDWIFVSRNCGLHMHVATKREKELNSERSYIG